MSQVPILDKYPKYTSFLRRQSIEKLQNYEKALAQDLSFNMGVIGAEEDISKSELAALIETVIADQIATQPISPQLVQDRNINKKEKSDEVEQTTETEATEKVSRLNQQRPKVSLIKVKKRRLVDLALSTIVFSILFVFVAAYLNHTNKKLVHNGDIRDRKFLNLVKSENSLVYKVDIEKDPIQLAYIFEEASKKIATENGDPIQFLIRAIASEKLMLLDQAEEDYASYLKFSGNGANSKIDCQPVKAEQDVYEKLESLIDSYLASRANGTEDLTTLYLTQAKAVAEEIAAKDDRTGLDLIEFYSSLPERSTKELLRLRERKNIAASTAAIDQFREMISELTYLESAFHKQNAEVEVESIMFLLAKFLMKNSQHAEASRIVEEYIPITERSSHKLSEAKFTFLKGEIANYKGNAAIANEFHTKSLKQLKSLSHTDFSFYPLYAVVGRQATIGDPEAALLQGSSALSRSFSLLNNSKVYASFGSIFAQFQGTAASNLGLETLSEAYLKLALKIAKEQKLNTYAVENQCLLAVLKATQGKKNEAFDLISKTYEFNSQDLQAQMVNQSMIFGYKGKVFGLLGNYTVAEDEYRKALEAMEKSQISNLLVYAQTKQGLAEALWLQGKKPEAREELEFAKNEIIKSQQELRLIEKPSRLKRYNFTDKSPDQILLLLDR